MTTKPFLSVIIPAYNEEKRLTKTLEKISSFLQPKAFASEIIIIDDGSIDKTAEVAEKKGQEEKSENLRFATLRNITNLGKGGSIRNGVAKASGELILFTDADNSTPIEEFDKLLPFLEKFDLAIGSRYLKRSSILIHQPWYRKMVGRLGNLLIQLTLLPSISDTQCGFKLFKQKVAQDLFKNTYLNRWGFDMEILFLARKRGYKVIEVPVIWLDSSQSRLRPFRDSVNTLKELWEIKRNNWQKKY